MAKVNEVFKLCNMTLRHCDNIIDCLTILKPILKTQGIEISSDNKHALKTFLINLDIAQNKINAHKKEVEDILSIISPRIAKDIEIETLSNAIPGIAGSDQNAISNNNKNNAEENKTPEDILFNFALNEEKDTE